MPSENQATDHRATLHMVCGKIAAGKSTLTGKLAQAPHTILISEDQLLSHLYPGEIRSLADYVECVQKLRRALQGLIEAMLRAGSSVVLDFPANTVASRSWMKSIFTNAGAAHCLHYLELSDAECKRRLRRRNEEGAHQFQVSEAEFDQFSQFFVPPTEAEGFNVRKA